MVGSNSVVVVLGVFVVVLLAVVDEVVVRSVVLVSAGLLVVVGLVLVVVVSSSVVLVAGLVLELVLLLPGVGLGVDLRILDLHFLPLGFLAEALVVLLVVVGCAMPRVKLVQGSCRSRGVRSKTTRTKQGCCMGSMGRAQGSRPEGSCAAPWQGCP